jgi:SAM-dependent methyltransferase
MWRARCRHFTGSYFFPEVAAGTQIGQFTCVDLGSQPFSDHTFDVVVTQDVLEHVPEPAVALAETCRTLKSGGVHVFTVPRTPGTKTRARAVVREGNLVAVEPAVYHRNPIDRSGSLVVTDWGGDLESIVEQACGFECVVVVAQDARRGYPSPVEIFVVRRK